MNLAPQAAWSPLASQGASVASWVVAAVSASVSAAFRYCSAPSSLIGAVALLKNGPTFSSREKVVAGVVVMPSRSRIVLLYCVRVRRRSRATPTDGGPGAQAGSGVTPPPPPPLFGRVLRR